MRVGCKKIFQLATSFFLSSSLGMVGSFDTVLFKIHGSIDIDISKVTLGTK
jgi:hypothetical protein